MKILITGNMGYIGPLVVDHLRSTFPAATLVGYDMGFFASCLTNAGILPEAKLDVQLFGDVRTMPMTVLQNVDIVIHLAAISNDPMGNRYEDVTLDVNFNSSVRIAKMAKSAGVKTFVFASSCSMYGASDGSIKKETSSLNPLSAYASSKFFTEKELEGIADKTFTVTCLRFATACGMSDRLRLDLVLNDFVASAVACGAINILSDGSPWRPLIHVRDMARAIEWASLRDRHMGGDFLAVNTGCDEWNYRVYELANLVSAAIPGTVVHVNKDAVPDKRSYQVSFGLFKSLAPDHQPLYTLQKTITELWAGLIAINFKDQDFRKSSFMRLEILNNLQASGKINERLEWNFLKKKQKLQLVF